MSQDWQPCRQLFHKLYVLKASFFVLTLWPINHVIVVTVHMTLLSSTMH